MKGAAAKFSPRPLVFQKIVGWDKTMYFPSKPLKLDELENKKRWDTLPICPILLCYYLCPLDFINLFPKILRIDIN